MSIEERVSSAVWSLAKARHNPRLQPVAVTSGPMLTFISISPDE